MAIDIFRAILTCHGCTGVESEKTKNCSLKFFCFIADPEVALDD